MKKFLKKLFKALAVLAGIFVVLAVIAIIVLKCVFTDEKIKGYVDKAAKEYIGREVKYENLSFNFIGVTLKNFAISENPDFSKGTFGKVDKFIIKVRLKPLLKKEIRVKVIGVDGLDITVIKDKNNKYNFDDILEKFNSSVDDKKSKDAKTAGDKEGFIDLKNISLGRFYIKNSNITFINLGAATSFAIRNLNADAKNFNFVKAFNCETDFIFDYQNSKQKQSVNIPLSFSANINLREMDMQKTSVEVLRLKTNIEDMVITGKTMIKNFKAPEIAVNAQVTSLTNNSFKQFAKDLPKFSVGKIDLNSKINVDLEKSAANILSAQLSADSSKISAAGNISWKKDLDYKISANLDFTLDSLIKIIPGIVKEYEPQGKIKADAVITPTLITANAKAENVAFKFKPMFTVEAVNANVAVKSADDIKLSALSGYLNGKYFKGMAGYSKTKTALNVNIDFEMESLILDGYPKSSESKSAKNSGGTGAASKSASLPLNLTAKLKAGEIKIPYFYAQKGATFNANLTGITDKLDKVNGDVTFNVSNGEIEDIDKLTASNKIAKMLFTSLAVVEKAARILKIDGMQKQEGNSLQYDSFFGDFNFVKGKMTIKTMNFLSALVSMKVTGATDFNTEKLDMKANVYPGANKPVIIKIGGTLPNPKSSLDIASSAVAIFGKDSTLGKIGALLGGKSDEVEVPEQGAALRDSGSGQQTGQTNSNSQDKSIGGLLQGIFNK
ncbi:AsmA family protein [Endomicrobium proavitum]|uniref:AsmA family protein n=1 Tax=Endomicrobium proavitum TaxID=1408281 RepID=A0A0G3WIZ0_9BACT|nr:AsmA family protein [Endomicrobium proavitum]AKL98621.1 conserved exported protein of unknown function [Endomicrobium proavitum]